MKKYLLVFLLASATLLQAQPITIDESKATVKFVFVDEDVEGTISEFDFTGAIDLDNLKESSFSGTVATETLDTDNWIRNKILRGRKYFGAKDHAKLEFKSTSVKSGGGREFLVYGNLTIKGITKPVTLTFTNTGNRLYGSVVINASHWDINVYKESDRNMVNIMITLPYSVN